MNFELDQLRGSCLCGMEHKLQTKSVMLRSGAVEELAYELLSGGLRRFQYPVIICDTDTWLATDGKMNTLTLRCFLIQLSPSGLRADEKAVDQVLELWRSNIDLILAVGAGTIHDISRYIANEKNIPFISVPTAASMDGFASSIAEMTFAGRKELIPAKAPIAVYADTEIFAEAPYFLTAAGVADMVGKYTALADWRIASLLTGEPFCEHIYEMQKDTLIELCATVRFMTGCNYEACERLMNALIFSGLFMQMMGNCRPVSGSEHHLAHFWEMGIPESAPDSIYGERVAVGLLLTLREYKKLLHRLEEDSFTFHDPNGIPKQVRSVYAEKGLLFGIIIENTPDPMGHVTEEKIRAHLPEIIYILEQLPEPEEIEELLKKAGCKTKMREIGLSDDLIIPSLTLSPYVRNCLTVMRLLPALE